jgi:hypothetical protein
MFGLEKPKREKYEFDLEKEIKENPTHAKKYIEKAEARILDIKKQLREGTESKEFNELDILLHGYGALQKTLKKITK